MRVVSRIQRRLFSMEPKVHVDQAARIIYFEPNHKKHTASVIYTHGLGDTANGWAEPCHHLAIMLPWIKFILPTAPNNPVTLNGGIAMPSWYDIEGLSERALEKADGIEDSKQTLIRLMEKENELGISNERIILAGFSQGGALSLYCGLSMPNLAGILCMSGYLPNHAGATFNLPNSTPILQCHGTSDPMVPYKAATMTNDFLKQKGYAPKLLSYRGLEHSANEEELGDVCKFLKIALPDVEAKL